jgi:FAD/FMN-containing dehydrogenase
MRTTYGCSRACSRSPSIAASRWPARGGGTGTNGQSLTDGVIVDLSRNLNRILEINADERWVRVQAGVVKDQLNAALKPHGLFSRRSCRRRIARRSAG